MAKGGYRGGMPMMGGMSPVSYTHLDVYKRQALRGFLRMRRKDVVFFLFHPFPHGHVPSPVYLSLIHI